MLITADAPFPSINNCYKISNSCKCSRCKPIVGHGHAKLRGATGGTSRGRGRF